MRFTAILLALIVSGCGKTQPEPEPRRQLDVHVVPDDGRGGGIKVDVGKDGRPIIDVDIQRGQHGQ